jgi:nitrogen fixation NifU-like protein
MKDDLYHQAILDLARRATGHGRLEAPTATVRVDNPLCGDRVTLDLDLEDDRVRAVGHEVRGCLLCQAAATAIGTQAPGQTSLTLRDVAERLRNHFVAGPEAAEDAMPGDLWPELAAFEPVRRHKSRHECVLLPFSALIRALDKAGSG